MNSKLPVAACSMPVGARGSRRGAGFCCVANTHMVLAVADVAQAFADATRSRIAHKGAVMNTRVTFSLEMKWIWLVSWFLSGVLLGRDLLRLFQAGMDGDAFLEWLAFVVIYTAPISGVVALVLVLAMNNAGAARRRLWSGAAVLVWASAVLLSAEVAAGVLPGQETAAIATGIRQHGWPLLLCALALGSATSLHLRQRLVLLQGMA